MTDLQRKYNDLNKEKIVHKWLEKILWSKFPTYKSNTDITMQKLGCDCTFVGKNNIHYICDEKAVTREKYINQPLNKRLNTFCLELSMRTLTNNNQWIRYDGWLLNDKSITNCYCFVWIDQTKSGTVLDENDIISAEIVIFTKDSLIKYLDDKYGWTIEKLKHQKDIILNNPDEFYTSQTIKGIKFNMPQWLSDKEAPVNALLTRQDYQNIALKYYTYYNGTLSSKSAI